MCSMILFIETGSEINKMQKPLAGNSPMEAPLNWETLLTFVTMYCDDTK